MPQLSFNNRRAYREGWALFNDGELQRLDDPAVGRPKKCECDSTHEQAGTCCRPCWRAGFRKVPTGHPVFESDASAMAHVLTLAHQGSRYHRQAIRIAAGIK